MGGATSHTKKDYETLQSLDDTHAEIIDFWYSSDLSRTRVYPQSISTTITLPTSGVIDTFGAWTQIIPTNLIPFDYTIHSLQTEAVSTADSFFIQLAISTTPAGNQYLGEKRFIIGAAGRARLTFACPKVPALSAVYGRVKTALADTTIDISVAVDRFVGETHIDELLAAKRNTWPW